MAEVFQFGSARRTRAEASGRLMLTVLLEKLGEEAGRSLLCWLDCLGNSMKHRRGKSELHRAVCSLTARAGDGFHRGGRTSPVRKVPQKTYRPVPGAMLSAAPKAPGGNTGGAMRGKGEKVRVASATLK